MRVPAIIIFLQVLFVNAFAQANYQPGSINKKGGEIINGWIDYREWEKNPREIRFMEKLDGEVFVYTINDLIFFKITDKDTYERAIVSKDIRPVSLEYLTTDPKDSVVTDTVFLQVLVQARKLSLYALTDDKNHFYIKDTSGDYEELIYKVYLQDEGNGLFMVERPFYRNQLMKYITDEPNFNKLEKRLRNTRYNEEELGSFVRFLNGETGSLSARKTKNKPVFFISGGPLFSTLRFTGSVNLADLNYSTSVTPTFGLGMDIFSGRNLREFTFRLEALYSVLDYKGSKTEIDGAGTGTERIYSLKLTNITPAISVLYSFLRSPSYRVYVGAGIGYNFSSYPLNEFVVITKPANAITKKSDYIPYEKSWLSVSAHLGAIIKNRFEVTAAAKILGSFGNFINFGVNPNIYSLRMAYRF